jgi:hypothetical protein
LNVGSALIQAFGLGTSGAQLQTWGPDQSSTLAAAAKLFGDRTLQGLTSLQFEYDEDALAVAQQYAAWYATPIIRITSMMVVSYSNGGANLPQMLGRGLYDRLTVQYQGQTPGPVFNQDSLIEDIAHNVTMDNGPTWTTTWALSPYEIIQEPMILDVWTFGTPSTAAVMTL